MNTFSICLNREITLAPDLADKAKFFGSKCTPPPRNEITLPDHIWEYWPEFQAELARHDKDLPAYIPQNLPEPSNAESGIGPRSNSPPEHFCSSLM